MIEIDALHPRDLARLLRAVADRLDPPAVEQSEPEPQPELIDVVTAAERFGRSTRQIRRLCEAGAGIRVGGRWQVDPAAVRRLIREK